MTKLTITNVERTWVSVPLKERHARHLTRENWDWTVFEVLKVQPTPGHGVGETMCYSYLGRVPGTDRPRHRRPPFELLDDDRLGAVCRCRLRPWSARRWRCLLPLLAKARDECPISW